MLWTEKIDNESLVIVVLGIIALTSMVILGTEAAEITLAVGSGLVGYLSGKASKNT